MLIPQNWLKTYIPKLNITPEGFRDNLKFKLAEVEEFKFRNEKLSNLVVGEILEVSEHPKSKKLHLCKVKVSDSETLDIVCGAPNVRNNLKVVVCLPGGSCLDENGSKVEIKETEIATVKSNGMMCSERELGLSSNHEAILELNENEVVGTKLTTQEEKKGEFDPDVVYEIENKSLTHRSDCFGIKGIAREVNAIFELNNFQEIDYKLTGKTAELPISIEIQSENCHRFSAITIKNVKVGPSPIWLMDRLASVGIRPVNNVVDITNFVMMDLGQPTHAYDYDKIEGNKLVARDAKQSEEMNTLDGNTRKLNEDMMVICDGKNNPVGIAGIMGGLESEISNETTNIIIEAANFEMFNIRRTSRTLGLRSEASTRFEKGLDPELTIQAITEVASLIIDIAGGEIASEIIDNYPNPEAEKFIEFDFNRVSRFLGISVEKEDTLSKLKSLGLNTDHAAYINVDGVNPVLNTNYITLMIPSWRRDLNIEEDIIEEVGRLNGYNNIEPTLPKKAVNIAKQNELARVERIIKNYLITQNYNEMLNYSFVNDKLWQDCNLDPNVLIKVENPIAPEIGKIRNNLLPSLLEKAKTNIRKFGTNELNYFEFAKVSKPELVETNGETKIPLQESYLALISTSELANLVGVIADIFAKINLENFKLQNMQEYLNSVANVENNEVYKVNGIFNQIQSGIIKIANEVIGYFGNIHPEVAKNFKLENAVLAQINIDLILQNLKLGNINYKPIFEKEIVEDLSFEVSEKFEIGELIQFIKDNFENVKVSQVDRFDNEKIHSVTVRIISKDKKVVAEIVEKVQKELKLKVR